MISRFSASTRGPGARWRALRRLLSLALVLPAACDSSVPSKAGGAAPPAANVAGPGGAEARHRRERGRRVFLAECSGCHGERGRGDGPAAEAVASKPRDFVAEPFKYRTTPSGSPPRRQDILETIARGMPGSSMPAFTFLTDEERGLVADYVLWLAGIDAASEPPELALPAQPPASPDAVARGRKVYADLRCGKCHGDSVRGDGPSSADLKDSRGRPISARDLTTGLFRRGRNAAEIYRTFLAGIDGTPMPSYADSFASNDGWDLAAFIQAMPVAPEPPPADPIAHGHRVVEEKQCQACHVIAGIGGRVGPSLDVSAKKLRFQWMKEFLTNPRPHGKIYPFTPWRMPDLGLRPQEVEAVLHLLADVSGRKYPEPEEPPPAIPDALAAQGTFYYVVKCAECHNLGNVIPTPAAKQQGPDLIQISRRLRFEWIPEWVKNPMAVYPGTSMVDTNLSDDEIQSIRAFLWKTSAAAEHQEKKKP